MPWNANEARLCGVRVSRPGCREPSGLLPRGGGHRDGLALYASWEPYLQVRASSGPCHPRAISVMSGMQRSVTVNSEAHCARRWPVT